MSPKEGIVLHTNHPYPNLFQTPKRVVLLPVGAIEQHGPVLPLDTDLRIANLLAEGLEETLGAGDVLRMPSIPFSLSWEHRGFPGMVSLSVATLYHVLDDVMTSLGTWVNHRPSLVVVVNWHGGNQALESTATELTAKHRLPLIVLPSSKSRRAAYQRASFQDVHAGFLETSITAAFWPEILPERHEVGPAHTPSFKNLDVQTAMQGLGIHRLCPTGVWGNANNSSSDQGESYVRQLVNEMASEVREMLSLDTGV